MCQHHVSAWAGVRSPSPLHVRCDGCGNVLRVRMRGMVPFLVSASLVLTAVVGYATWHVMEHANYMSLMWVLLALAVFCALEGGTLLLYARYGSLEGRHPSPPSPPRSPDP